MTYVLLWRASYNCWNLSILRPERGRALPKGTVLTSRCLAAFTFAVPLVSEKATGQRCSPEVS